MTMSPRMPAALLDIFSGAGNDNTLVGLSIPRQSRLRTRTAESSVSRILTSPPDVESAAAAAIASRTVCAAPGCLSQSGDCTSISTAGANGAFGLGLGFGLAAGFALNMGLALGFALAATLIS